MFGRLQIKERAVQFDQRSRKQSVVAAPWPKVIHSFRCLIIFAWLVVWWTNFLGFCSTCSGNYMGDPGARLLSKALQINTSLRALSIDRNSITVHGYSDIAYALERYSVIRFAYAKRISTSTETHGLGSTPVTSHPTHPTVSVFVDVLVFTYCFVISVTEHWGKHQNVNKHRNSGWVGWLVTGVEPRPCVSVEVLMRLAYANRITEYLSSA